MRLKQLVGAGCLALMTGCAADVDQPAGEEEVGVAQQELKFVNPGRYLIASVARWNRFLDVAWGNPAPGTAVQTWNLLGGAAQWWNITHGPGESYFLQSDVGTFLDVPWANPAPGTAVHQWTYNGGVAQQWILEPANYNPITAFYIKSVLGNCLEAPAGDKGQQLYVARCTGLDNQKWRIFATRREQLPGGSSDFRVPPHTYGDNDFDGHGPDVHIRAGFEIRNGSDLWVNWSMRAQESRSDWTTAEGWYEQPMYRPTDGRYMVAIHTPAYGELYYTDNDHSDDYVFPGSGENPIVNLNHPVRHARVVGDTNGGDAGRVTGARLYFNPITIEFTTTEGVTWPQF